ncbi:hypothetical protein PPTG_15226 [Phytophthora nicotianae INRA-310]|uniref:Uncharacterized protein n=1 Tax=Phytophthora nicotianae (strain INRA-310) TaxID=761204 RepID=W2PUM2_PHYN3|nr:hypothetical protein PPTG_15226 [Phytophthora nicotianae INRA-310]ETN03909.1 hypothetical protein PPTG_15226 [Phytophthora nicotianae INRA-310]
MTELPRPSDVDIQLRRFFKELYHTVAKVAQDSNERPREGKKPFSFSMPQMGWLQKTLERILREKVPRRTLVAALHLAPQLPRFVLELVGRCQAFRTSM